MKIANPKKNRGDKELVKYAHIGYPKCASTALQKGYLGRHSHLLHLGCGAGKNSDFWDDLGYIDEGINQALEVDLRYKTKFAYDAEETAAAFQRHFDVAEADEEVHAVGISNENLCFNWHGGIETPEKAKRLFEIMGHGTQIILVLRDQKSLIESLYKESIRFGYSGTFQEYQKYLWQYKDRNYFYDFCFSKVIDLYRKLFGEKNVHILFFEDLKADSKRFLERFSEILNVDYHALPFDGDFNKQLSPNELAIKRIINDSYPHTFEKGTYHPVDTHRYVPYLTDEESGELDVEHYFDYYVRHGLGAVAEKIATKAKFPELDMSWSGKYGTKILSEYEQDNRACFEKFKFLQFEEFSYTNLTRD